MAVLGKCKDFDETVAVGGAELQVILPPLLGVDVKQLGRLGLAGRLHSQLCLDVLPRQPPCRRHPCRPRHRPRQNLHLDVDQAHRDLGAGADARHLHRGRHGAQLQRLTPLERVGAHHLDVAPGVALGQHHVNRRPGGEQHGRVGRAVEGGDIDQERVAKHRVARRGDRRGGKPLVPPVEMEGEGRQVGRRQAVVGKMVEKGLAANDAHVQELAPRGQVGTQGCSQVGRLAKARGGGGAGRGHVAAAGPLAGRVGAADQTRLGHRCGRQLGDNIFHHAVLLKLAKDVALGQSVVVLEVVAEKVVDRGVHIARLEVLVYDPPQLQQVRPLVAGRRTSAHTRVCHAVGLA